jgi:hypothetical protein
VPSLGRWEQNSDKDSIRGTRLLLELRSKPSWDVKGQRKVGKGHLGKALASLEEEGSA